MMIAMFNLSLFLFFSWAMIFPKKFQKNLINLDRIGIFFLFVVISLIGNAVLPSIANNSTINNSHINESSVKQSPQAVIINQQQNKQSAEIQAQQQKDKMIYNRIKEKVQRDFPNDYITQKFIYDESVEGYEYMKTVTDIKIKKKLERDFPNDYVTQKMIYGQIMDAKAQMESLGKTSESR